MSVWGPPHTEGDPCCRGRKAGALKSTPPSTLGSSPPQQSKLPESNPPTHWFFSHETEGCTGDVAMPRVWALDALLCYRAGRAGKS